MNARLRAAIVGPGRIGSTYDDSVQPKYTADFFQGERRHPGLYTVHPVNHAGAYRTTDGFELVAVVGRDPAHQAEFANRWSVRAYSDLEEMLQTERPDVLSVCTQSDQKSAITLRAVQAVPTLKAIIVEKAMATSAAEADAMVGVCRAAGILLVVNHPYRYSRMVREIKGMVDAGDIGPLRTASGFSGPAAIHIGTHVFDLLRFVGGDFTQIMALGSPIETLSDQGVSALVRFTDELTGFVSLEESVVAGFDLRGSVGKITFSTNVGDAWKTTLEPLDPNVQRRYPLVSRLEAICKAPNERSATQQLLTELRMAIIDGAPVISTGEDGRAALEAGIGALISKRDNVPVDLPLRPELRTTTVPNR